MNKKIGLIFTGLCVCLSGSIWAQCPADCYPINTVTYQLHVEQWATTQTAKVIIQFDGALTAKGSADIEKTIDTKLQSLSSVGKWYITNVVQTKDSSDLQRITLQAEARLPTSEVSGLQDKVKSLSKPGATFTVANIDFSPSAEDIQAVKAALRSELYQMASTELQKLNQLYSTEHFSLHSIEVVDATPPFSMQAGSANNMVLMKMDGAAPAPMPMIVNRKIQLDAKIEFASKLS